MSKKLTITMLAALLTAISLWTLWPRAQASTPPAAPTGLRIEAR